MFAPENCLPDPEGLVNRLVRMQRRLRDHVLAGMRRQGEDLTAVVERQGDGDTVYRIDERSEVILLEEAAAWGREMPFVLIAEGLPGNGWRAFPDGSSLAEAAFLLVVDPIDGTREIMYDKRSAWTLAGVAPNRGAETTLADIEIAVQTEIPTTKHLYGDTLMAIRGRGAIAERENLLTGETTAFSLRPSSEETLAHGFASVTKFFPGFKSAAAMLEENLFEALFGGEASGNPLVFDDQYIATSGQLYELIVGHDRFQADLRPALQGSGFTLPCCHPYDLCTELIAREAGVLITDERGRPLSAPLDIRARISWVGYANQSLRERIAPILERLLYPYLPFEKDA